MGACGRSPGTQPSFRVPEYTHLPTLTEASWAWNGEPGHAPETVLICADRARDYVLVALWPDSRGRIGLVPLGGQQAAAGRGAGVLPVRAWALMLEHVQDRDTFWGDLDR